MEPVLAGYKAQMMLAGTFEGALSVMNGAEPPSLVLLDADLPGMGFGRLRASLEIGRYGRRFATVLISDNITAECSELLAEGTIDDLIPKTARLLYWQLRLDQVIRTFRHAREPEPLWEEDPRSQTDPRTGIHSQDAILSMLFRETDRVQRMKTSLCLLLFELVESAQWSARPGSIAYDDLLLQMAGRTQRLLRTYDLFGRTGKDEFLLGLPGCSLVNAVQLAERIRFEVFSTPFSLAGQALVVSGCFGAAESHGRSPIVVLREAAKALQLAKASGPGSIRSAGDCRSSAEPAPFFASGFGDDLLPL
jgi:diguanylate cyclase (GGDEF)-like protein